MASSYNLTPERKEKLKKEVMEELGKTERPKGKPQNKKITPITRGDIQPLSVKVEEKKPVVAKSIIKPEPVKPVVAKEVKVVTKTKPKVKKAAKKKSVVKPKVKKVVTPAPSPISKKPVRTQEEKIRERDLFFRPDSPVRPSISSIRILKRPKIKIGSKKMFIFGAIACLILFFVIALSVDIFGIYKLGWSGQISQKVINVLPLPAGTVDGRAISLSDYYDDLNVVKNFLASTSTSPILDTNKTKEQLFNRLVSVNIVENELKRYGKSVTDDAINEEMNKVITQIGSEEKATQDIKSTYGMDIPTFKKNVLKPILAMYMLGDLINSDESLEINKEVKKNADDALKLALEPGTDFATLVLQYSNDPSTLNRSGDMGWISKGELPKEIEDQLFSLKDGEVYNQVVKDEFGYHIYKVETKLIDKDSGKESIKLSQIFITVNTELYIKSLFDKAIIKRFI